MTDMMKGKSGTPKIVDRAIFQAQLDELRVREKAHTHAGDAIAAARRRLPMVEVDPTTKLIGSHGPVTLLDAFEGRQQLIAYYFMWHTGHPAPELLIAQRFPLAEARQAHQLLGEGGVTGKIVLVPDVS